MTAKFEIYDPQGNIILDAETKVLVVRAFRKLPNIPLSWSGYKYFYTGQEEVSKLILVRPAIVGNSVEGYCYYSSGEPHMYLTARNASEVLIAGNTGTAIEVALAEVGTANDSKGYIDVYAPNGTFSWSLGSFYKCVRVLSVTPISGLIGNTQWATIPIPDYVTDLNNVFIVPPYELVTNNDNGTDSTYSASGFKFKIIGRNLLFMFTGYNQNTNTPVMGTPINLVIVETMR